jgi:hypothetical protein
MICSHQESLICSHQIIALRSLSEEQITSLSVLDQIKVFGDRQNLSCALVRGCVLDLVFRQYCHGMPNGAREHSRAGAVVTFEICGIIILWLM